MCSMVTLWLATRLQHPIPIYHPIEGIKVLGVPLGISTFTSFLIKDARLQDVWHVTLLLKMGDAQLIFGSLICCFMQCPLNFLWWTPPFSTFIESFISFDSFAFQLFWRFLGPRSFDSPKRPLACKQTAFPITFGGVGFMSTSMITLITYLRSWVLLLQS